MLFWCRMAGDRTHGFFFLEGLVLDADLLLARSGLWHGRVNGSSLQPWRCSLGFFLKMEQATGMSTPRTDDSLKPGRENRGNQLNLAANQTSLTTDHLADSLHFGDLGRRAR